MMTNRKYATVEYFAELFSDIISAVDSDEPDIADNILKGFYQSLDEWLEWHEKQTEAYKTMKQKVTAALGKSLS